VQAAHHTIAALVDSGSHTISSPRTQRNDQLMKNKLSSARLSFLALY
jgi:hypothetical protein